MSTHTRHAPLTENGAVDALTRYVWDGSQLLYEMRASGSSVDSEWSSGKDYGRVGYVHAGGVDAPLGVVRQDATATTALIVPFTNWRGDYEHGYFSGMPECTQLASTCLFVDWPAPKVRVYRDGMPKATGDWVGSLIQEQQDESGLLYQRNRYYDPMTGQFTKMDPIGLAGGLNLYGFAAGDPVNFSDPLGLKVCFEGSGRQISRLVGFTEQATYTRISLDDDNCVKNARATSDRREARILQGEFAALVGSSDTYHMRMIEGGGSGFDEGNRRISIDVYPGSDLSRRYPVMSGGVCGGAWSHISLPGLVAHELGHAYVFRRGGQAGNEKIADAYQNLYAANSAERLPYRCAYTF